MCVWQGKKFCFFEVGKFADFMKFSLSEGLPFWGLGLETLLEFSRNQNKAT